MKKEFVEIIVKGLMKKLCMEEEGLDDIMRDYTAKSSSHIPIFGHFISDMVFDQGNALRPEGEQERKEKANSQGSADDVPESAREVFFPWEDVIGSMMEHPDKVTLHWRDVCLDCGKRLIHLEFWSPYWTWRALCGRSGPMTICLDCPKQVSFDLAIMN